MPTDAKLGLVAGVVVVLTAAVVFFRREPANDAIPVAATPPVVATPTATAEAKPTPAVPVSRSTDLLEP